MPKGADSIAAAAAPVAEKAYKGSVMDLFRTDPVDVTCEKSRYETFTQRQAVTNPLEIVVDKSSSWRDMKKTVLEFDIEFTQADGTTLLQPAARVAPVNNIAHSLIRQIQVQINNIPVNSAISDYYYLEAYTDRLINYSKSEKEQMSIEGWYEDTPGRFNVVNPLPHLDPAYALGGANAPADDANNPTSAELNPGDAWMLGLQSQDRMLQNHGATKRHNI